MRNPTPKHFSDVRKFRDRVVARLTQQRACEYQRVASDAIGLVIQIVQAMPLYAKASTGARQKPLGKR